MQVKCNFLKVNKLNTNPSKATFYCKLQCFMDLRTCKKKPARSANQLGPPPPPPPSLSVILPSATALSVKTAKKSCRVMPLDAPNLSLLNLRASVESLGMVSSMPEQALPWTVCPSFSCSKMGQGHYALRCRLQTQNLDATIWVLPPWRSE